MSFSPEPGAYGPQGSWAQGNWAQGNQSPGGPGRPDRPPSTFVRMTGPILLLVLGLVGFFLGFAPALDEGGETGSMFEYSGLIVFPMVLLISGLIGIAGLIPGERTQLWASTAISGTAAVSMLCLLINFDDDLSTTWAYWLVFTILLAQIGVALFAIFIGAGVITVTAQPSGMGASWQGPGPYGPPQAPGPQMPPPPTDLNPQVPPPAQR